MCIVWAKKIRKLSEASLIKLKGARELETVGNGNVSVTLLQSKDADAITRLLYKGNRVDEIELLLFLEFKTLGLGAVLNFFFFVTTKLIRAFIMNVIRAIVGNCVDWNE